jgi:hypothetical protein
MVAILILPTLSSYKQSIPLCFLFPFIVLLRIDHGAFLNCIRPDYWTILSFISLAIPVNGFIDIRF